MTNQEDNIAIRLKFLIQNLGITNSVFADNCGIARASLSQLLTGRNKKISDVIIGQIHQAYPNVSIMWLLFGEGDMWLNKESDAGDVTDQDNSGNMANDADVENLQPSSSQFSFSDGPKSQNSGSQNSEFRSTGRNYSQEAKENGVRNSEKGYQNSTNEEINNCKCTADFLKEIEILRQKSRKVVQITVYYDDSTFESFFPGPSRK